MMVELKEKGLSALSLDAMPRISRAQSMDVLSSQSNLSGYKAVICGADNAGKSYSEWSLHVANQARDWANQHEF